MHVIGNRQMHRKAQSVSGAGRKSGERERSGHSIKRLSWSGAWSGRPRSRSGEER